MMYPFNLPLSAPACCWVPFRSTKHRLSNSLSQNQSNSQAELSEPTGEDFKISKRKRTRRLSEYILSGGFRVGGTEARQKRGDLWCRYHTQPIVIITFDLPKIHPRVCSWHYGITEIAAENAKGCSWYTTLKALKVGKTRLITHKSYAIASWHRSHFFSFAPHFSAFTINNLQRLPLWKFHTFPSEKMLSSWYPEFVHINVFVRIHETIKKQPRRFKTLNLF